MTMTSALDQAQVRPHTWHLQRLLFLKSITMFSSWLSGLLCCSVIDMVLFSGVGEEEEVKVTVNTLFIAPKVKPTQDTTKDFTPRVETFAAKDWDHTRELPKQPVRTEVGLKLFKRTLLATYFSFYMCHCV